MINRSNTRPFRSGMLRRCLSLAMPLMLFYSSAALAKKDEALPDVQTLLDRAGHSMHSGHSTKAVPKLETALEAATTMQDCVAIADFTEKYGTPLLTMRRQCMQKALTLCKTRDDYMSLAQSCRKAQCFEVERSAIEAVLKNASTTTDLYEVAKTAHHLAATDVVHESLSKAYELCKNVPDALQFARFASSVGQEDLTKKAVKDMIDDEQSAHELMTLLEQIEPFGLKDLDRYLLKKSLDVANKFDDYAEIATAARRFGEVDIRNVAVYRAKKKKILQQVQIDKDAKKEESATKTTAPTAEKGSGF